ARRLGAVVEAFDVRPAVRDEVRSLGATFVELELASESLADVGGVAPPPPARPRRPPRGGRPPPPASPPPPGAPRPPPPPPLRRGTKPPVFITEARVKALRAASGCVDLAAETGGNCDLTHPPQPVGRFGVRIRGPVTLPASMPQHASQMYSRNLMALVNHLVP